MEYTTYNSDGTVTITSVEEVANRLAWGLYETLESVSVEQEPEA